MKKTLVVYYSRSGNTKKVVEGLAQNLGPNVDVEELIDTKNRKGIIGWIMSGRDATMKKKANIEPVRYSPEQYEHIIIGTPVWASTMSSAVRTYIDQNKSKFRKVAFLTTQGGQINEKVFKDMAELSGKPAAAVCSISNKELKNSSWQGKIKEFVKLVG